MAEISTLDVRRAAMDLLARREHGFEELISKLKRRFTQNKYTFEPDFSAEKLSAILPVSYTHLTLPTIYSV